MSAALPSSGHQGVNAAAVVVLAGVSAALHIAKLFPALPVLRESFGITLVQAGFLLSAVQLAGMTLGLAVRVRGGWRLAGAAVGSPAKTIASC